MTTLDRNNPCRRRASSRSTASARSPTCLSEIDYAVNHGQAVPCLVCDAPMTGGDLGTPAECPRCGSTLE